MPLPLTVSCFSKIQIGITFLVPAHPGSPGQRAAKRVCVTVTILLHKNVTLFPISEFTVSTFEYVSLRPQVPGQTAVKRMCVNGVCSLGPKSPHCKRHLDRLSRFCTAHSSMCQHTHTHARTHARTHTHTQITIRATRVEKARIYAKTYTLMLDYGRVQSLRPPNVTDSVRSRASCRGDARRRYQFCGNCTRFNQSINQSIVHF